MGIYIVESGECDVHVVWKWQDSGSELLEKILIGLNITDIF